MDPTTFDYLKPTDEQLEMMTACRQRFTDLGSFLTLTLPEGPDKTYLMRKLREVAMWANITITRQPNGAPR
jgi:hypothetical protein